MVEVGACSAEGSSDYIDIPVIPVKFYILIYRYWNCENTSILKKSVILEN